jgi:2-polyprenyl-3-methyl-5-hydroxy-6-metoxy-1,4-benzoquinol methylase
MDYSNQQKQAKEFFEEHAKIWSEHAKSKSTKSVNVVKMRNQYVEKICSKFLKKNAKTLDVACGVGDLVLSLLKKGYDAFGVDFATSMIEQAKSDAKKSNFSTDRFFVSSFFEFEPKTKFDLISANGFIEYISQEQLIEFIDRTYAFLENNGILVVESRNRLFNVFSFNKYTQAEIELKQINYLLEECILFNTVKNLKELLNQSFTSKVSENLHQHEYTSNEFTNITVDKRYQYTPFELMTILRKYGFEIIDLIPYHIHAITTGAKGPKFKHTWPIICKNKKIFY